MILLVTAWVVPLKDKKGASIVKAFQKIVDDLARKPKKIWVDKGSDFYNSFFTKCLKDNDIEMYSIHNKRNSVVAERFIRTLKTKIYKCMTSISKNVYIDTYHKAIKIKPVDVKDNTYIDSMELHSTELCSNKKVNDKCPEFGDHVRISKYKSIFANGYRYTPNWSEQVFVIKKVKNTVPWAYVINDLNGKEIIGTLYEKEIQKTN